MIVTGVALLASNELDLGLLLNILHCTGQPLQKTHQASNTKGNIEKPRPTAIFSSTRITRKVKIIVFKCSCLSVLSEKIPDSDGISLNPSSAL